MTMNGYSPMHQTIPERNFNGHSNVKTVELNQWFSSKPFLDCQRVFDSTSRRKPEHVCHGYHSCFVSSSSSWFSWQPQTEPRWSWRVKTMRSSEAVCCLPESGDSDFSTGGRCETAGPSQHLRWPKHEIRLEQVFDPYPSLWFYALESSGRVHWWYWCASFCFSIETMVTKAHIINLQKL